MGTAWIISAFASALSNTLMNKTKSKLQQGKKFHRKRDHQQREIEPYSLTLVPQDLNEIEY